MTENNNLIFYDTETTGIQRDFSQILQCGSVLTDNAFNSLGEQDIGCAPLPWIIPNPRAMLTNKKTNLFNSNVSHYEMILDLQRQWKQWTLDNPGIFISYNFSFVPFKISSICLNIRIKVLKKRNRFYPIRLFLN
mgnify:CR=1 FL=1